MMKRTLPVLAALLLSACSAAPLSDLPERLENPDIRALPPMSMFGAPHPEAPRRSNTEIARDFLDLSFEMESGREIPTLTRFEGPVTITVHPGAPATLIPDLDRLITRLRNEAGIDIQRVPYDSDTTASITVETLPRARMQRAVPQAACFVVPRVSSWDQFRVARSSSRTLDWTTLTTREEAAVFIPNDVSPQEIRDCLHEEIAQGLGPLNDLYRLADSIFNDDNFNAVLTGFDMLILRAYYDGALQSGMTRAEVAGRLPAILNRLHPAGAGQVAASVAPIDRQWTEAIEDALGGRNSPQARITAAERAVSIATNHGWRDSRLGFSWFALGRLSLTRDPQRAIHAFTTAGQAFRALGPDSIQLAHVNVQLAAFALSQGDAALVQQLVGNALPAATRGENASLLATLLMIRAEALDLQGRSSEAAAVRLDSLGWARYGFGRDQAVRDHLTEVAALSPQNRG